ncbi:MAG: gfo/Idh/MocA family oxidoreductase [Candidatus Rokuibacteriota bacterium]|nr:MAG: gfo/Idh/MocA family oxidoreductase [Candidatus Rokubacteria bacterium]
MLKVAIVGCGKIADAHAEQIQRITGCQIVGVCDREPLMARQLYERFPVARYFADLDELLHETRPDVVHVTTPPQSHAGVARACLERGCHVYVEKPFALTEKDAQELVALADDKGLKLTVGHDDQFSHVARRMRRLIERGFLGGAPVHMESYYAYDLGDAAYARALLGDPHHWVRRLPGRLLHNIISHGVARIAEFLPHDSPRVMAHGFVSPFLKRLNETEIMDELRVIICAEEGATAYFTVSSQMRPALHQFRVYGPKNGLVLDQDQETLITLRGGRFKSYMEKFVPPVILAGQHLGNVITNGRTFLARDFHMKAGMKYLIEAFYRAIVRGTPVPIPYREILLTARIMDAIFDQIGDTSRSCASARPGWRGAPASGDEHEDLR